MLLKIAALIVPALFTLLSTAQAAEKNDWVVRREIDRLDDKETIAVQRYAETTMHEAQRRPPVVNLAAGLSFICRLKRPEIIIQMPRELIVGHRMSINFRVDKRDSMKGKSWLQAEDSSAAILKDGKQISAFIREMQVGKSLFVRIEDGSFGITEMTFDLEGLEGALAPIKSACKI